MKRIQEKIVGNNWVRLEFVNKDFKGNIHFNKNIFQFDRDIYDKEGRLIQGGGGGGGIPDAPATSQTYGREDYTWKRVVSLDGDYMTGDLGISTSDAQRVNFIDGSGDVRGSVYHSDSTNQVVLARFDDTGAVVSQLILGSDGVSIAGPAGGAPVIDNSQDIATKQYVDDNAGSSSPLTNKGDIYAFDTDNTRLPVGTDGQILTANSGEAIGLKWEDLTAGYGYFLIWAEENADVATDNYEWSYGNGANTGQGRGIVIGVDCELYAIGIDGRDSKFSVTVEANGTAVATSNVLPAGVDSELTILSTPAPLSAGDVINFRTAEVVTSVAVAKRVSAHFRYELQGIKGAKGDTGAGVNPGGTTGQFLIKLSDTDFDTGWADVETDIVKVKDTSKESWSTTAGTQADVNKEAVQMDTFSRGLASLNRETDLFLADASAVLTEASPTVTAPTTETKWLFNIEKDSTNELLLTIDEPNSEITLKKIDIKYNWDLILHVNNLTSTAKTFTTRVRRKSDDTLLQERIVNIPAEVGNHYFTLNTISLTNDTTDNIIYTTIEASDTSLEIVEASSRIYADTPSVNADVMHWAKVWDTSGNTTYYRNDVVRDENYLSVCIAPINTTDRPAPQHSNIIEYQMNYDGSGWEVVTLTDTIEIDTGHDMEVINGGWFHGGRVWVFNEPDFEQTIAAGIVHSDGTFHAIFRYTIPAEQITAEGWYDFRVARPMGVFPNTKVGLDIMVKSKAGFDDVASGVWQYDGTHPESVQPWAGKWSVKEDHTYLQIHEEQADNLGIVDLSVVQVGDFIELQQNPVLWKFEVTSIDYYQNNAYRFYVNELAADGDMTVGQNTEINITRESTNSGSVKYVRLVDGTVPYENINGVINYTTDNNMYGTDFFFEEAIQSPDWEVMSYTPFTAGVEEGGLIVSPTTLDVVVYDPQLESTAGTAESQYEVNINTVESINLLSAQIDNQNDIISKLVNASMELNHASPTYFPTTEQTWDFTIGVPSSNIELLDADDTTDTVNFKKAGVRYTWETFMVLKTHGNADKTITIRLRKVSDNSLINETIVDIQGGVNKVSHVVVPVDFFDNTEDNLDTYATIVATDDEVEILDAISKIYSQNTSVTVGITSDTTGTTSEVQKIWTGTQTEYNDLGSYDNNTLYFIQ